MLILTRKPSEELIIGDDWIRILLMSINGNQVRFGITAPREVDIHRLEIFEKIKANEIARKTGHKNPADLYEFESRS